MRTMSTASQYLLREAQFTNEILGAGATQIRHANYASKGLYFQAFTSLSTGLERIGKLCLIVDHYIETAGQFPPRGHLKQQIGHDIGKLYARSQDIIAQRSIRLQFLHALADPIHVSILSVLKAFAAGDRYSNIDALGTSSRPNDPIASWHKNVDTPLYEAKIGRRRKGNAQDPVGVAKPENEYSSVFYFSESGSTITSVAEAARRLAISDAVAPYRQLYVLQIIRYWVELLWVLEHLARSIERGDIPFFSELFRQFYNEDRYFKSRRTWTV